MPPATGTFSTMIVCLRISPMRCANSRAITSLGPPAANGLTMVIGRLGHSSALAPAVKVNAATASSAVTAFHMVGSECLPWAASDERDRFGHFEDSSNFDQGALQIRFGGGRTEAQAHAEAFPFHPLQRAGRRQRD